MTNLCLKRLARKGYIKVVNVQPRRLKYLVTPKGISEKTRLTYEYAAYSFAVYRVARRHLAEELTYAREDRGKPFLGSKVLGVGDLAEAQFDRILVTSFDRPDDGVADLLGAGVPPERILTLRGPVAGGETNGPEQQQAGATRLQVERQ